MFKKQKQQQQARKGNNRWADDDDDITNTPSTNNIYSSNTNFSQKNNVPSFIKKTNFSSPNNNTTNTKIPKDTRFALEKKLIDDILQPTGIKVKPDEKLMIDFCRRAKNLDRTLIYSYLMEKISPYKTYIGFNDKINTLIKCLYLVMYIIDSKIQDLYEVFLDNQQIFIDIKNTFHNNKKISELTEQILQLFGIEGNKNSDNNNNDYQNFENNNNINEKNNNNNNEQNNMNNQNNTNANLLDFGTGDDTNNNTGNSGNINLLEDIFPSDGNSNNNNQQMNNNNNNTNDLLGGIFGSNVAPNTNNPNPLEGLGIPI